MFKTIRLKLSLFLFVIYTIFLNSCFVVSTTPAPPTPLGESVTSPVQTELMGQWRMENGSRFGDATLEFQSDGTLLVENINDKGRKTLQYIFVDENTLAVAGDDELAGTVKIKIENDEMSFDMVFADEVFGTIFSRLKRVK